MNRLIVVDHPERWPLEIPDTEVVAARTYLTSARYVGLKHARVYNLCRTHGYQSVGYYVSLLATARGHRPLPSVTTVQDLRLSAVLRIVAENLEEDVQRVLGKSNGKSAETIKAGGTPSISGPPKNGTPHLASKTLDKKEPPPKVVLPIYFGRNPDPAKDRLCRALFDNFPAPLLRAEFVKVDEWRLSSVRLLSSTEIPESDREFAVAQARRFFERPRRATARPTPRYDLAILLDPHEVDAPSDERAIARFERAAEALELDVSRIGKDEYARLDEYDALFIRETTSVNHHTYRFASRAAAHGLVVIDDPESIVRCTNKVFLAEAFERASIPAPKTMILHRGNREEVEATLGFPCVLKRPDSSFSMGVSRVNNHIELKSELTRMLGASELVVAQAYTPSTFDWRIGLLGGQPLYACRYHMAAGHWQIQKVGPKGGRRYGKVDTLPLDQAPPEVVDLATRAAALIGTGFYGVDIKPTGSGYVVMEVNDNPSVEAGVEDAVLGDELYRTVMRYFVERLEQRVLPQVRR